MTAEELLGDMRARGVNLQVRAGRLIIPPGAVVSDAEIELLRRHKSRLLRLLMPAPTVLSPAQHKRVVRATRPQPTRAPTRVAQLGNPEPFDEDLDVVDEKEADEDPDAAAESPPRDSMGRFLPRRQRQSAEQRGRGWLGKLWFGGDDPGSQSEQPDERHPNLIG